MGYAARHRKADLAMTRTATFSGDSAQSVFDILWTGINVGRVLMLQDTQGKQARDERRKDVVVLKALKACSTAKDGAGEDAPRAVTPDSVLTLPQPEHERLVSLVGRVPWETRKIEAVEDALDWLSAADKA
jgi:hypothetical protein